MTEEYLPIDLDAQAALSAQDAEKAKQRQAQAASDWRFVLGDKRGRRVVWGLLEKAGVFKVSYSPEALQMAFNEGGRNIGLGILAAISEHAPDALRKMQSEAE
jgi:hypothetical protein